MSFWKGRGVAFHFQYYSLKTRAKTTISFLFVYLAMPFCDDRWKAIALEFVRDNGRKMKSCSRLFYSKFLEFLREISGKWQIFPQAGPVNKCHVRLRLLVRATTSVYQCWWYSLLRYQFKINFFIPNLEAT